MSSTQSAPTAAHRSLPPALLLMFFGSGCAALIYEVVWFHLLRFVVGGSSISLGFLLGSFMGGMCLGNAVLPRLWRRSHHPLRVYAVLELGIAAYGLILPKLLPVLGSLYLSSIHHTQAELLLRASVSALALLPPTILMGATLPAIAQWVGNSTQGIAALGRFYGSNILGGVAGTLLAGFWLLRAFDTNFATWAAAAINVAVALLALALAGMRSGGATAEDPEPKEAAEAAAETSMPRMALIATALSGATALGAEVVWTRLLSLLFGASVYAFALILAVFLIGLGIGSAYGSKLAAQIGRAHV